MDSTPLLYGTDYSVVAKADSDFYSIKIKTGNYSGVIFTFGKVQIKEDTDFDCARLAFDFKIEECPKNLSEKKLNKSREFKEYLAQILINLLNDQSTPESDS